MPGVKKRSEFPLTFTSSGGEKDGEGTEVPTTLRRMRRLCKEARKDKKRTVGIVEARLPYKI